MHAALTLGPARKKAAEACSAHTVTPSAAAWGCRVFLLFLRKARGCRLQDCRLRKDSHGQGRTPASPAARPREALSGPGPRRAPPWTLLNSSASSPAVVPHLALLCSSSFLPALIIHFLTVQRVWTHLVIAAPGPASSARPTKDHKFLAPPGSGQSPPPISLHTTAPSRKMASLSEAPREPDTAGRICVQAEAASGSSAGRLPAELEAPKQNTMVYQNSTEYNSRSRSVTSNTTTATSSNPNDIFGKAYTRRMKLMNRRLRNAMRGFNMSRHGGHINQGSYPLTTSHLSHHTISHYALRGGINQRPSDTLQDPATSHIASAIIDNRKRKRIISPFFNAETIENSMGIPHELGGRNEVAPSEHSKLFWVFDTDSDGLPINGRKVMGGNGFEEDLQKREVPIEVVSDNDESGHNPESNWANLENQGPDDGEEAVVIRLLGEDAEEPIEDPAAMEHRVCGHARRRRRDSGFSMDDFRAPLPQIPLLDPTFTSSSSLRGGNLMSAPLQHAHFDGNSLEDVKQVSLNFEMPRTQQNRIEPTNASPTGGAPLTKFKQFLFDKELGEPSSSKNTQSITCIPSDLFSDFDLEVKDPAVCVNNTAASASGKAADKVSRDNGKQKSREDVTQSPTQSQAEVDIQIPLHDGASDVSDNAIEIPEPGPEPYSPLCIKSDWGNWVSGERGPFGNPSL
ncbi:hypothetical protein DFH27DRAFT_526654 [Peziza echinospora]|nr:hypothetical protein DFH27DRAFT_526654 [Peziza echinospora]